MSRNGWLVLGGLLALVLSTSSVDAAFITIDDSDPDTITITAGDFEEGFFVNGNLLTTGLGNSGSVTLADGGYSISGSWIDLGQADNQRVDVLFAEVSDPNDVTSGVEFGASSDGFLATLNGSFGGYLGTTYFQTLLGTFPQDGSTVLFGLPFLSGSFTSEVVPEPGTLTLFGLGLPVAGLLYRRRRAS